MTSVPFDPSNDIPSLHGKVLLVTGGTAGLGKESILQLAKHNPERIFFTGRNQKSAAKVIEDIKAAVDGGPTIDFIECDLASFASTAAAAKKITAQTSRLDILLCNAGIMGTPPGLTTDGYEIQFGTNHLGHALLIKLLLPTMLQTAERPGADVRIVSNTSVGFKGHPKNGIDFPNLRTTQETPLIGHWIRYGQSKLANILYASEIARRHPQITSTSVHPGVINTGLVSDLGLLNRAFVWVTTWGKMVPLEEGAKNQLWCATVEKGNITNGGFYEPVGIPGEHDKLSNDAKLAAELWEWTQTELAGYN